MRQRILALAAVVSALAGGTVVFVNWESGKIEHVIVDVDGWQLLDRDSCAQRACAAGQCDQARNHLVDGGFPSCDPRFVACDWRVSGKMRSCLEAAGVALPAKKYQRVELLALRCPAVGAGVAWGIPTDDAGCPIWATSSAAVTPRCVRAPRGNTTCLRDDGSGPRFFGELNVFPSSQAIGTGCEPVGCAVFFGDNPEVDL